MDVGKKYNKYLKVEQKVGQKLTSQFKSHLPSEHPSQTPSSKPTFSEWAIRALDLVRNHETWFYGGCHK